jgi:hypothetical protein
LCGGGSSGGIDVDGGGSGSTAPVTVAMKTPAETAMTGGKTTINNQLKAAAATVTKTAMMKAMATTMKMKAMAATVAAAARRW